VYTVFLDRDGVINRKAPEGEYVSQWDAFHPLPGAGSAIARLNASHRRVFVVTNQRGVALGLYTHEEVNSLHEQLRQWLAAHQAHVDGIYYCPHDKGACRCRKPLPGLFEQAISAFPEVDPSTSVMIGDSLSDIEAGRAMGMATIYIHGEAERSAPGAEQAAALADYAVGSLEEAVALL
jgi:D-glycero-D-manno-heptose 1,7-bisphosphate phosphatase